MYTVAKDNFQEIHLRRQYRPFDICMYSRKYDELETSLNKDLADIKSILDDGEAEVHAIYFGIKLDQSLTCMQSNFRGVILFHQFRASIQELYYFLNIIN